MPYIVGQKALGLHTNELWSTQLSTKASLTQSPLTLY